MLQPHQILLYEFAELILNQRIQKRPSTLKHSHILNLWQIKGVILEPGKELRLQINFYLQRWNTKILVETWVLEVIITKEQQKQHQQDYLSSQSPNSKKLSDQHYQNQEVQHQFYLFCLYNNCSLTNTLKLFTILKMLKFRRIFRLSICL